MFVYYILHIVSHIPPYTFIFSKMNIYHSSYCILFALFYNKISVWLESSSFLTLVTATKKALLHKTKASVKITLLYKYYIEPKYWTQLNFDTDKVFTVHSVRNINVWTKLYINPSNNQDSDTQNQNCNLMVALRKSQDIAKDSSSTLNSLTKFLDNPLNICWDISVVVVESSPANWHCHPDFFLIFNMEPQRKQVQWFINANIF